MDGEEVQLKPDALAHLADALMEDIVATPSHQLAIEEIVDAGHSRELVFRFDDILAEAVSSSSDRPASLGSRVIWNLTDALCEDMAAHPDETVLTGVSDDRSDDRSLAGKFDDILRRDLGLAMAGLKLPHQPGPTHPALYVKATLAQLLDRLIAPPYSRAAAGAFATVVTAAIVASVVYQPWRQTVEPDRFAAPSPGAPKSLAVAHSAPPAVADFVPPPVLADARNAGSAARSLASTSPQTVAADGEQKRFAAASPEPPKPSAMSRAAALPAPDLAPLPAPAEGRSAGGAAKSEAPLLPAAIAEDGGEKRVAAASPESLKSQAVARPARPPVVADGRNGGSAAMPGASPRLPAIADEGEKHILLGPPVSPMVARIESHPAPEGRNASSAAKLEASLPPAAGRGRGRRRKARRGCQAESHSDRRFSTAFWVAARPETGHGRAESNRRRTSGKGETSGAGYQ
jgi:hypothetical protein